MLAHRAAGIRIPRTSEAQQRAARHRSPQVGDVPFYGSPAYHVAIVAAVRNGRVVDTIVARHTGTRVQHQALYTAYTVDSFV
jgi:peptidoglycan DL-endopeptidase CwlO